MQIPNFTKCQITFQLYHFTNSPAVYESITYPLQILGKVQFLNLPIIEHIKWYRIMISAIFA